MPLGDPRSVPLNVLYHKEQEYIWFMCGDLNDFCAIWPFYEMKGVGMLSQGPFETHLQNFISVSIIPQIISIIPQISNNSSSGY